MFEELQADLNKVKIYKTMQSELLAECKDHLIHKYPEFEKEIFKSLLKSCEGKEINIVLKYPKLKSSKTLITSIKRINHLAEDLYDLQTEIEDKCSNIRYYKNSKWEIFKPSIPTNLYDVIYSK
jgi:hypothetical protein